jgi:hypothetical protein
VSPVNPFPIGDVIDEECSCGHLRTEHAQAADFGLGECLQDGCPCAGFDLAASVEE